MPDIKSKTNRGAFNRIQLAFRVRFYRADHRMCGKTNQTKSGRKKKLHKDLKGFSVRATLNMNNEHVLVRGNSMRRQSRVLFHTMHSEKNICGQSAVSAIDSISIFAFILEYRFCKVL